MLTDGITTTPGRRRLVSDGTAHSCFFRSAALEGERKALLQITERCNLHCAHCFVSSTTEGADIDVAAVAEAVIPRLLAARARRLTLTGGEPFVHPGLMQIVSLAREAGMSVGICTNATCVTDEQIAELADLGDVHVNVSFDGFRPESHGRFRGSRSSFELTVATTRKLAEAGLLQGLLSTPNTFTNSVEYQDLVQFAALADAEYILMNPLSAFGRGIRSRRRLGVDSTAMEAIRQETERAASSSAVEVVPIRFPNSTLPLAGCVAGEIIYVFVSGDVAVCPYLVFAARTPGSRHNASEFLIGNIFKEEIAEKLDAYRFHERYTVGTNDGCVSCELNGRCGKGCPAAVIAAGGSIGDRDVEVCPKE